MLKKNIKYAGIILVSLLLCADVLNAQSAGKKELYQKYIDSSRIYREQNPTLSLSFSQKALNLIPENDNSLNRFYIFLNKLYSYSRLKDSAEYLQNSDKMLAVINLLEDKHKAVAFVDISKLFRLTDQNDSSFYYANKAYSLVNKVDSIGIILDITNTLASSYRNMGKYELSVDLYEQIIEQATKKNDMFWKSVALGNIGLVMKDWGKYEASIDMIRESIELYEDMLRNKKNYDNTTINNIFRNLFNNYNNIAMSLTELDRLSEATHYLNRALEFAQKRNNNLRIAQITTNLGNIYIRNGNADSALVSFRHSLKISEEMNALEGVCINNYNIAYILNSQGKYYEALIYARRAYDLVENQNFIFIKATVVEILVSLYEQLGDYKNAYLFFKMKHEIKDSLLTRESEMQLAEMQAKYDFDKQEAEKVLILQKKNEARFIYISIIIIIILLLAFTFYRYKTKSRNNMLLSSKNKEIKKKNKELSNLVATKDKFFSIISHDLRNPLGNIMNSIEVLEQMYDSLDEDERKEFIEHMGKSSKTIYNLLENLLTWSRSQRNLIECHPVEIDFYDICRLNADIITPIAQNKQISVINNVKENSFAFADANMINTVVRNILSNAVKFTSAGGFITIDFDEIDDFVVLSISDTGVGMSESDLSKLFKIEISHTTIGTGKEKGTGLGLILSREFIDKHNGKIEVESELGKGTCFRIMLPSIIITE